MFGATRPAILALYASEFALAAFLAVLLGSRLDSVRDAGRYDGPLGVLVAIAAAARLRDRELPFALEVAAFADEEGVRYGTAYLGSGVLAGGIEPGWLERTDEDGVALVTCVAQRASRRSLSSPSLPAS